jgi:hypothetical protein
LEAKLSCFGYYQFDLLSNEHYFPCNEGIFVYSTKMLEKDKNGKRQWKAVFKTGSLLKLVIVALVIASYVYAFEMPNITG